MADRRTSKSHSGSGSASRTSKDNKTKTGTLLAPLDRPSTSKLTTVTRTSTSTTSSSRTKMPTLDNSNTRMPTSSTPRLQTKYTSTHDIEMASRQSKIETLSRVEREKQEKWAQSKLSSNTGACLDGFGWQRKTICQSNIPGGMYGYICKGGAHFVSDELLVKGNGKCYLVVLMPQDPWRTTGSETWYGPYDAQEIYGIFGGSKREYERRFERGRGKVDLGLVRNMRIVSSEYSRGPWPSHMMAVSEFFN